MLAWVMQGIPESIGSVALILSMGLKEIPWKKTIIIGLIQAVFIYTIRLFPLAPYTHTILAIPAVAISVSVWTGLDIRRTHLFATITVLTIAFLEMGVYYLLDVLGIITFEEAFARTPTRIITGMPQVLALFILAWAINRIKKKPAWISRKMNCGEPTSSEFSGRR